MDTSTCVSGQSNARRKFYQWTKKWACGLQGTAEERAKPDLPILASYLQAIGFKLVSLEKINDAQKKEGIEPGALKVAIECGSSKMKAVLELRDVPCRCSDSDNLNVFWSVIGTEPSGSTDSIAQKVEESGSNLLPRLPKDVTRVLYDVSYKLFETISSEPDVNRNTDISLNSSSLSPAVQVTPDFLKKDFGEKIITRSNTQPEIRISENSFSQKMSTDRNEHPPTSSRPGMVRQKTWDIDIEKGTFEEPRPLPLKRTSSPTITAELSSSLGQLSLQDDENPKNLTEYIVRAKRNLEKALTLLMEKSLASVESLNQDECVKSVSTNVSPTAVITPYKPKVSNVKPLSKLPKEIPKQRRSLNTSISRTVKKGEQETKPSIRRNSFYIPSSNSTLSLASKSGFTEQKITSSGKNSVTKSKSLHEPKTTMRNSLSVKKTASMDTGTISPKGFETNGRVSMIKPPTKIAITRPSIVKPVSKLQTK